MTYSTSFIIIAGYLVILTLGILLWLLSKFERIKLHKVGVLMDRILHHRTTRIAIILGWWWVGWHFLVNQVAR
ncbi:MAG: hypothetical protein RLZZ380_1431 [Actinomycetota bacterium]|jgi:hypothetical protein